MALLLGLTALLLLAGRRGRVFWSDFKVVGLILGGYLVFVGIAGNLDWRIVETALMFTLGGWLIVAVVRGEDDEESEPLDGPYMTIDEMYEDAWECNREMDAITGAALMGHTEEVERLVEAMREEDRKRATETWPETRKRLGRHSPAQQGDYYGGLGPSDVKPGGR